MDGTDGNGICFPYDVLLHILRCLPCRALSESRRVCRAWRSIVPTSYSFHTSSVGVPSPASSPTAMDATPNPASSHHRSRAQGRHTELMTGPSFGVLSFSTTSSRCATTVTDSSSSSTTSVITSVTWRRYEALSCHYRRRRIGGGTTNQYRRGF